MASLDNTILSITDSSERPLPPITFEENSCRIPVIIRAREEIPAFFDEFYTHRNACSMICKTTAEWNSTPELISKIQVLYIYTDGGQYTDSSGQQILVPTLKFGDGATPLIDMPFVDEDVRQTLLTHISDGYLHFAPGEREWLYELINSKVDQQEVNNSIIIFSPTGYMSESEVSALYKNSLKTIIYNTNLYRLAMKTSTVLTYAAPGDDPNILPVIKVTLSSGRWVHEQIPNTVLTEHIGDSSIHVTDLERAHWNNKINIDSVVEERLIFNRN